MKTVLQPAPAREFETRCPELATADSAQRKQARLSIQFLKKH
jgi:hypothetical protein